MAAFYSLLHILRLALDLFDRVRMGLRDRRLRDEIAGRLQALAKRRLDKIRQVRRRSSADRHSGERLREDDGFRRD